MDNTHMTDQSNGDVQTLTLTEYNNILMAIRYQPAWRKNADIESDYYDGKQLDSETLALMAELGMAPIIENLTAPTIDAVLGLEAKTRLDWKVTSQKDDEYGDVAEALNVKLNESEKESRADRANSDAFAAQVKSGLGWIEVGREGDPFKYPYRYEYVHRNEIFWDFKAKKQDLSDAKYLVRRKWYEREQLELAFPDKKDLLGHVAAGWAGIGDFVLAPGGISTGLASDYANESFLTIEEQEWRDVYNRRLVLNEVWYRQWVNGFVIKKPDGSVIEFDKNNKIHQEAVAYGIVKPKAAVFSKLRLSWWVGAHCLADIPNPYKHGKFPYIPFWGKREDMTNVPYGLIRAIKPMQDEVNARNTKMQWLLAAKRITMTEGVTKDDEEMVRREAGRPDAMHILDPVKLQSGGMFKVETDFQLNTQQYQSLVDKRQSIKNVAGVYAAFEGNAKDMSGIAVHNLTEQSSQTLAEVYDNFSFARTLGGELLLSLIVEDMGEEQTEVQIDSELEEPKKIILNMPVTDGSNKLDNDVQRAKLKVALSDVPSTSSYRAQRLQMLTQITQSLPPQLQALILKFVMSATDLPERKEIVKAINKFNGEAAPEEPKTPEEAQAMQAAQQEADAVKQMQVKSAQLDLAAKEATVNKTNAEANKINAEVNKPATTNAEPANPQATQIDLETKAALRDKIIAETKQINSQTVMPTALAVAGLKANTDAGKSADAQTIEKQQWIIDQMTQDQTKDSPAEEKAEGANDNPTEEAGEK